MTPKAPTDTRSLRFLLWLLGAWCLLSVAIGYVAIANFVELRPDALRNSALVFGSIADLSARTQALHYVASELNRHFFTVYGWVNLLFAALAMGLLAAAGRRERWPQALLLLCLVMAVVSLFYLTPAMVELGRLIDFMPRDPRPPEVTRFFRLHGVSDVLELVKLVSIAAVSVRLVRSG